MTLLLDKLFIVIQGSIYYSLDMNVIYIKDLLLRTEVGFSPHEIGKKQDVILNLAIYFELIGEEQNDTPSDALDYKVICKDIISKVESEKYNLIEALAYDISNLLFENERVNKVDVTVDKPNALRFAKSVAFRMIKEK